MSSLRCVFTYVLVYLLWFASIILGTFVVYRAREAYLSALVLASFDHSKGNASELFYTGLHIRAVDVFSLVVAGLFLVSFYIYLEYFYRSGIHGGQLWARFFLVTAFECGILSLSILSFNIMVSQVVPFSWKSLFFPIIEMLVTGFFVWLWLLNRRHEPSAIK